MAEILAEFSWPVPYKLDDNYVDFIHVEFPKSSFLFYEGFESEMGFYFSQADTKQSSGTPSLKLGDALIILRQEALMNKDFQPPVLTGYWSPLASLEKVKNGLRDICILMQAYLLPCVEGDFSWVERYMASLDKQE